MDISIDKLMKEYSGKKVLDIDRFMINRGSFCGIIGPNGAGKSTLLNIIAGLEQPTSGKVFYGKNPSESVPLKDMTLVFQTPYMLSTTVEKNIAYPLRLRGWDEVRLKSRVTMLLNELGLTELKKQKSIKLSGGEMQKVALARALSFHPKLLLLDEPTANIDPGTTAEIERLLKKINEEEGTTIMIITHNLAQAKRLCKEVAFMNRGKVIEWGKTTQVLKEPISELTKKFVAGELLT